MLNFGWGGGPPKDFGPTVPSTCTNCQNQTVLHYVRTKKWFRLFFIPVFPYESQEYLLCPVCTRGITLNKEQAAMAMDVAHTYDAWHAHQISDDEYNTRASRLLQSVAPVEQAIEPAERASTSPTTSLQRLPSRDLGDGAGCAHGPRGPP